MKKRWLYITIFIVIFVIGMGLSLYPVYERNSFKDKISEVKESAIFYFNSNKSTTRVSASKLDGRFDSGSFVKEDNKVFPVFVRLGEYCAYKDEVVKGHCNLLDKTPPVVSNISDSISSNKISVTIDAYDFESGIKGYQFSSDSGATWTDVSESSTYEFKDLKHNTSYSIIAKVINNNNVSYNHQKVYKTQYMRVPILSKIEKKEGTEVKISFPERLSTWVYSYKIGDTEWETVAEPEIDTYIIINENNIIRARITDGKNTVYSSDMIVSGYDD